MQDFLFIHTICNIIVYQCNLYQYDIIHLNSNIMQDFCWFLQYTGILFINTICKILVHSFYLYQYDIIHLNSNIMQYFCLFKLFAWFLLIPTILYARMQDYCFFMQYVSIQYNTFEFKHCAGFLLILTIFSIFAFSCNM